MRIAVPLAALTLALGALAGCGGDVEQSNEYVDAVNTVQTDFARTFDELQRGIDARSTPQDDAETLESFETAIDGAVARLGEVEPPGRVSQEHERLVGEIERYGEIIARTREQFDSDEPREILAARTQLSTDVAATSARINQAIDAINKGLRE